MGLISKEVEVQLNPQTAKYYENLGYEIPRIINKRKILCVPKQSKILIKTEHLLNTSKARVDIECDGCGDILKNIVWKDYKRSVKSNNKYYCIKCANNGNKKWISFEQWCLENNRKDILDRWDYELNNCKPNEITCNNGKKYYLKCPMGVHESELKIIGNLSERKTSSLRCNYCNSFAQWGIDNICEDFLEKYWDYEKNTISPWDTFKSSNKSKIYIKCQEKDYHESYYTTCGDFIKGSRCPYCGNYKGKVHKLDSLGIIFPEVLEIWSDKNTIDMYSYAPMSRQKIWLKCQNSKHKNYYSSVNNATRANFRCPECVKERNESILQEKVRLYLNTYKYNIKHENKCTILPKNPKTNHILPYDNEVVELKLIIEVHGQQHYTESSGKWFSSDLHKRKLYDRYKRIFAKLQGYFYLEIPYWTDNKEETWKKLIDEKIKEIKESNNIGSD